MFIDAAKARGDALDHVLFFGPPGLGKTTLAQIVAREMGVGFRATSGPVIAKSGDLAALLTNLEDGDVLFIDEIHRLQPAVEEVLYPAMEDRALDLMIGEGPSARIGADRPAALHPGRRDHAAGAADDAAARPLRHSGAAAISTPSTSWSSVVTRAAGLLDLACRRRRRARDRAALARHAAHRRAAAAPGARFRQCRGRRDRRRAGRRRAR